MAACALAVLGSMSISQDENRSGYTVKKWPKKVWCICYRDVNYPGGWAPYAMHTYCIETMPLVVREIRAVPSNRSALSRGQPRVDYMTRRIE